MVNADVVRVFSGEQSKPAVLVNSCSEYIIVDLLIMSNVIAISSYYIMREAVFLWTLLLNQFKSLRCQTIRLRSSFCNKVFYFFLLTGTRGSLLVRILSVVLILSTFVI